MWVASVDFASVWWQYAWDECQVGPPGGLLYMAPGTIQVQFGGLRPDWDEGGKRE